jgi:hypothetical protein
VNSAAAGNGSWDSLSLAKPEPQEYWFASAPVNVQNENDVSGNSFLCSRLRKDTGLHLLGVETFLLQHHMVLHRSNRGTQPAAGLVGPMSAFFYWSISVPNFRRREPITNVARDDGERCGVFRGH